MTSVSGDTTLLNATYDWINANATAGPFFVTLPAAASYPGQSFIIKKTDATFNNVNIYVPGSETIGSEDPGLSGAVSAHLRTQGETLTLVSDGTNYKILDRRIPTHWVPYTPTFSGFGTVTNVEVYWRRMGSNIEIRGKFQAGTVAASTAQVSFPTGVTSSNGNGLSTALTAQGQAYRLEASSGGGTTKIWSVIMNPNVTYITFGNVSNDVASSPLTALNASNMINNNAYVAFDASVPISGWVH